MTLRLSGFGTALPRHCFAQAELAEIHAGFCRLDERQDRMLKALYRRSGVSTRRSVVLQTAEGQLAGRQSFFPPARDEHDRGPATAERMAAYERDAPELAVRATRGAIEDADIDPGRVTHLVTVSCTGFVAPGVDAAIIDALGLPRTTERTNVGFMGCHGALNALRVARGFVEADPARIPLVCAVELCTLHFAYGWDPDMLVANALFADGAAAVLCDGGGNGQGHGRGQAEGGGEGDRRPIAGDWCVVASGTLLMPDSADAMTWRIGDHGFRMSLSARVPDLIGTHLRPWVTEWLGAHELGIDDVASWAVHPGGPRILGSVEDALGLGRDRMGASREVLSECGNMSSATILFILDRLRKHDAPRPCVALAFGPGLVVEALLIR
jgi:predicted naringenin-chalcone synthase